MRCPTVWTSKGAQSQNDISFDGVAKNRTEINSRCFQAANNMRGAHVKREIKRDSFQTPFDEKIGNDFR
jgi:hypothetical protein